MSNHRFGIQVFLYTKALLSSFHPKESGLVHSEGMGQASHASGFGGAMAAPEGQEGSPVNMELGPNPMTISCPVCNCTITTMTKQEMGLGGWLCCILACCCGSVAFTYLTFSSPKTLVFLGSSSAPLVRFALIVSR